MKISPKATGLGRRHWGISVRTSRRAAPCAVARGVCNRASRLRRLGRLPHHRQIAVGRMLRRRRRDGHPDLFAVWFSRRCAVRQGRIRSLPSSGGKLPRRDSRSAVPDPWRTSGPDRGSRGSRLCARSMVRGSCRVRLESSYLELRWRLPLQLEVGGLRRRILR